MSERVQIIVEATDAASGILRGITSQFGQMGSLIEDLASPTGNWGNITATAADMVYQGMKQAVDATMKYAQEVRDLSAISGASAEETSRFIQVLDDYQLSAQDAETATRFLTKNGYAPTIDTLAKLSDQYLSINDAQERNDFILKNLGRSGLQWVNVLKQGGDALRAQGEAVNNALILTDESVAATEKYRLEVDALNDSFLGLQVSVGTKVIPVLSTNISIMTDALNIIDKNGVSWGNLAELLETRVKRGLEEQQTDAIAAADAISKHADALNGDAEAAANAADAMSQLDYKGLVSSIQNAQKETDRFAKEQNDANEAMEQADKDLKNGKISLDQYNKILADNKQKLADNQAAHDKWAAQLVFDFAMARAAVDGISETEGEFLVQLGEGLGLWDEQTADTMRSVNKELSTIDASDPINAIGNIQDALTELTGHEWTIKLGIETTGTIPSTSGGGGGGSCFIGGTKVTMFDYSQKNIEDVRIGDIVLSYDAEVHRYHASKVTQVLHHKPEEAPALIRIGNLYSTPEHTIYCQGEWKRAGDLKNGDKLFLVDGREYVTDHLTLVPGNVPVYNIHTDSDSHNYFANGILVHNSIPKATGGPVYAGSAYVVGENGPEGFVPKSDGTIVPNSQFNYIYGPVTLAISGNDAEGLLGLRV